MEFLLIWLCIMTAILGWTIDSSVKRITQSIRHASLTRARAIRYSAKATAGLLRTPPTSDTPPLEAPFWEWAATAGIDGPELEQLRVAWQVKAGVVPATPEERAWAEGEWTRYTVAGIGLPPLA